MRSLPYPTRLRLHLTETRRRYPRLSFEDAWALAILAHPRPGGDTGFNSQYAEGWSAETFEFAKKHFRAAYYGQGATTRASILAEVA